MDWLLRRFHIYHPIGWGRIVTQTFQGIFTARSTSPIVIESIFVIRGYIPLISPIMEKNW
jgi:hypothetical protein